MPGTRLVVVTNPHNPTGHVLSDGMRRLIVERAAQAGAWLLADEVYQGAERDGPTTASLWGSYERVIVVNGQGSAPKAASPQLFAGKDAIPGKGGVRITLAPTHE